MRSVIDENTEGRRTQERAAERHRGRGGGVVGEAQIVVAAPAVSLPPRVEADSRGAVEVDPASVELGRESRAAPVVTPLDESFMSGKEWRALLCWTLLAFILRLALVRLFEGVITPDGTQYVALGRSLMAGNFREGLSTYWSPLYPLLVGLSTRFFSDAEFAGRFVSVVAGSLLVIPAHRLTRVWYGARAAFLVACLVALHPLLIYYSSALLTESTYTLLFTSGILAGWSALSGGRARSYLLAGVAFGACYLLKPEAAGFVFLLLAFVFTRKIFAGATRFKGDARNALLLCAGFMSLAAPYLLYLRRETGAWTISGKLNAHLLQGSRRAVESATLSSGSPAPGGIANAVVQLTKALRFEYEIFNLIFPPVFVLLVGLGLFRKRWTGERAWRELYLFSFVAATLAGYAVTLPNIRFVVPLVPLLLCWLSNGIGEFAEWAEETCGRVKVARRFWPQVKRLVVPLVVVCLLASLLPVFVYLLRGDKWGDYHGQKRAAVWIREHDASHAPVIMSTVPIAAFYARGRHVALADEDYAAFLARARREGVGYIVVNEREFRRLGLRTLLDEQSPHPGLRRVHELAESPGQRILVYRLDETATGVP